MTKDLPERIAFLRKKSQNYHDSSTNVVYASGIRDSLEVIDDLLYIIRKQHDYQTHALHKLDIGQPGWGTAKDALKLSLKLSKTIGR